MFADTRAAYICGVNMAWLNQTCSATPGVPARKSAVDQVASTVFAKPTVLDQLHVAVPSVEYKVVEHKGSLMRVSPEEITGAYFLAVARDIGRGEPTEMLWAWEMCICPHLASSCCCQARWTATGTPLRGARISTTRFRLSAGVASSGFGKLHAWPANWGTLWAVRT